MKQTTFICDIKKCNKEATYKNIEIQVIFTTEQTEGRSCNPYLTIEKLDLCEEHYIKLIKGNYIFGDGAQGYNNYNFRN